MPALLLALLLTAPPLTIDLGPANAEHGLTVPSAGDGQNTPAERAGRPCRVVDEASHYLYVKLDPAAYPPGDRTLYVTAMLFDDALQAIGLQYDAAADQPNIGTCYTAGPAMLLLGTGAWVTRTVQIEHARCGKGENSGADLRLDGHFAVAQLTVSDQPPAGWNPDQPLPAELLDKWRVKLPTGFEFCVGGEVDAATATLLKVLGVTSVESYVTWQTVEDAGRGQWDWSKWDRQTAILRAAGLRWTPFLIVGPAYANPKWFRDSDAHLGFVNLVNGRASLIESLWNPRLKPEIERFMAAFAQRYAGDKFIENILLGIDGTYGESIYPAGPEGGWTAALTGPYYNGVGWWAGDAQAQASFKAALGAKYHDAAGLNQAWGTAYATVQAVPPFDPDHAPSPAARADFLAFYEDAMTDWARWWAQAARKAFPQKEIYLCTGGAGEPELGANFTAQAKAIAPYGLGIRITNEGSDYASNFAVTREVATATRFYHTFCGFEPASGVTAAGTVARTYNVLASGARQLHTYLPNLLGNGDAVARWRASAPLVGAGSPAVPKLAVYLPREHWPGRRALLDHSYAAVRAARRLADLDLVNHNSVADGILSQYTALIVPDPEPAAEPAAIDAWVRAGGRLLVESREAADTLLAPRRLGPAPAHFRLNVGAAGDDVFLDGAWSHREAGGEFPQPGATKRWSGADPAVWLPVEPGRPLTIEIEAVLNGHSFDGGATATALLDGQPLTTLKDGRQVYRIEVPGARLTKPLARLSFQLKTWRPSDFGSGDNRDLGVALSRVEVWSGAADGPAVVNQGVELAVDAARLRTRELGHGRVYELPAGLSEERLGQVLAAVLRAAAPELVTGQAGSAVFRTPLAAGGWLDLDAGAGQITVDRHPQSTVQADTTVGLKF
jgi:hypothetical protein